MNDEASSSAAAGPSSASESQPLQSDVRNDDEERFKTRQMFNRKRIELLDDLRRNLDILIYAELSIIYYMDCAFLRFFMRSFAQLFFLTPKPSMIPEPPVRLPFLGVIIGGNILAILLHIWSDTPSAGEATRGYLHGGLAMDLIGQKGPTKKWILVALDVVVMFFQLLQLSTFHTRQTLKSSSAAAGSAAAAAAIEMIDAGQDLDSEERGVRRAHENQDIELQDLNPNAYTNRRADAAETQDGDMENDELLSSSRHSDRNILDAFHSGQIVMADLSIRRAIQEESSPSRTTAERNEAIQAMRFDLARQLIRWRLGNMPRRTV